MTTHTHEAGYTLAETLVALLILGLSMGGLMQAGAVIGHLQGRAGDSTKAFESGRRLQQDFAALFEGHGPFLSTTGSLEGDAEGFRFACGSASCGARLAGRMLELDTPSSSRIDLGPGFAGHFRYLGGLARGDAWPLEGVQVRPGSPAPLEAVQLVDDRGHGLPIALARVWRQEPAGCVFDAIAKACRDPSP